MERLVDCPCCDRMIREDERACPFCDSRPRRAGLPGLLLGCMLGLATVGCVDKPDGGDDSTTESYGSGVTYAAPPPTSEYYPGTTTIDAATEASTSDTGTTTGTADTGESGESSGGTIDSDTDTTSGSDTGTG